VYCQIARATAAVEGSGEAVTVAPDGQEAQTTAPLTIDRFLGEIRAAKRTEASAERTAHRQAAAARGHLAVLPDAVRSEHADCREFAWPDRYSMLQFGHGGEAVETPLTKACSERCDQQLQFGHGGEAVETSAVTPNVDAVITLQFGHGGEAVETRPPTTRWAHATGFNSATAVKPWKRVRGHWSSGNINSFNSATAVKPWKRPHAARRAVATEHVASIRPRR
jgi:hypothetical protein